MINVQMPWSGSAKLESPDSSICLVKDQFRNSGYGWMREVLAQSTEGMSYEAALEFWGAVSAREASYALFMLARNLWEEDLSDFPHIAVCSKEHETEYDDLDWDEFELTPFEQVGSREFAHRLFKPSDGLVELKGSLPALEHLIKVEGLLETNPEAAINELIRLTCVSNSGKPLSMLTIQKMSLKDRKKIKKLIDGEQSSLYKGVFHRICRTCGSGRKATGVLNLRGFF